MKLIFRGLISACLTFVALFLVLILFAVDFKKSKLPSTELSKLEYGTYYYSLKKSLGKWENGKKELVFSPRETSYLAEQYLEKKSNTWLEMVEILVRGKNENADVKLVVSGPLGLYYRFDFVGQLKYKLNRWDLQLESFYLGSLPLHYFLPQGLPYKLPHRFAGGAIELHKFTLDGKGMKTELKLSNNNNNYPLLDLLK